MPLSMAMFGALFLVAMTPVPFSGPARMSFGFFFHQRKHCRQNGRQNKKSSVHYALHPLQRRRVLHNYRDSQAVGSLESSPRIRCRQRANPVTGRVGSVHPIGQPMIQSEKFGLKVRSPGEDRGPAFKLMWSGRVEGKFAAVAGTAPVMRISSQICVHNRATLPNAICEPTCLGSLRNFMPLADSSSSIRSQ